MNKEEYLKHMNTREERLGPKSTDNKVFNLVEGGDKLDLFQPEPFAGIDTTGQTIEVDKSLHWTTGEMIGVYNNSDTDPEMKKIIEDRLALRGTYKEDISKYVPGQFESYETTILKEDTKHSPSYGVKIRFNPLDDAMVTNRRIPVYNEDGDYDVYGIASNKVKSNKRKTYRGSILNKEGDATGYSIVGDIGAGTSDLEHPVTDINRNPSSDYGYDTAESAKDIYSTSTFQPKHNSSFRGKRKRGYEIITPDKNVVFVPREDLGAFLTNIGAM